MFSAVIVATVIVLIVLYIFQQWIVGSIANNRKDMSDAIAPQYLQDQYKFDSFNITYYMASHGLL